MKPICTFSGECILQRNGVEVALKNNKAKTKTFRLIGTQDNTQTSSDSNHEIVILVGNSEEVLFRAKVDKLRKLHSTFIQDGRITLEIAEDTPNSSQRSTFSSDVSLRDSFKMDKCLLIMIKGVQAEILKNFCKLLSDIKKKKPVGPTGMDIENNKQDQSNRVSIASQDSVKKQNTPVSKMPQTPMTPITNKVDNSAYKVNRSAINSAYSGQKTGSQLKRNFDSVKKEGIIAEIGLSQKKVKLSISNPFKLLPDAVIIHIMRFLPHKDYINQKLVYKGFYQIISNARMRLDFRGKGDIPPNVIIKYLNSCHNLERICLGQSKHLMQKHFLEDVKCEFNQLKFIDFSNYMNLSDKTLMKFYRTCKTLETIKMGYYSAITDAAIDTIPSFLQNVTGLYIKCSNKFQNQRKEKITDTCLSKFLKKYDKLQHLSIYIVGPIFLYKAFESVLPHLQTLKIEQLLLSKSADLLLLENIGKCENLEFLKIGNILVQNLAHVLSTTDSDIFQNFLSKLPKLRVIKFGHFVNNYVLRHISNYTPMLEKLVLGSNQMDDDGLSFVLKKADNLVHIDVSHSNTINGHCFEDIVSVRLRKLIISFDEYRTRCVQQVLMSKALLGLTSLVNVKRK